MFSLVPAPLKLAIMDVRAMMPGTTNSSGYHFTLIPRPRPQAEGHHSYLVPLLVGIHAQGYNRTFGALHSLRGAHGALQHPPQRGARPKSSSLVPYHRCPQSSLLWHFSRSGFLVRSRRPGRWHRWRCRFPFRSFYGTRGPGLRPGSNHRKEADDWILNELARTFVLDEENRRIFEENIPGP